MKSRLPEIQITGRSTSAALNVYRIHSKEGLDLGLAHHSKEGLDLGLAHHSKEGLDLGLAHHSKEGLDLGLAQSIIH